MMVAQPPSATANNTKPNGEAEPAVEAAEGGQKVEEATEEEAPAPAPALPRKTWSMPKAPPPSSVPNEETKKKSLLEIMEEEQQNEKTYEVNQQKALIEKLEAEEAEALIRAMEASVAPAGNGDDDMDEDMKLALMLSMQDQPMDQKQHKVAPVAVAAATAIVPAASVASIPAAAAAAAAAIPNDELTESEIKEIEKALQDADAAEDSKQDAASLRLAFELQNEEDSKRKAVPKRDQGNVQTMSRDDFLRMQGKGDDSDDNDYSNAHHQHNYDDNGDYDYDDMDDNGNTEAGFRINSTKPSPWSRTDRTTIRGPGNQIRTKHDPKLQGQSNAYRLELRADDEQGKRAHVGNQAFNSFHRSMQKKTVKGVAAHGHGRATANDDKTRDGALDGRVRLQIARATNNGLIESFHGCVKEGKEALVFHAQQGSKSEGFDVAVKVFKRISEFKNRGQYVTNDPRYGDGKDFRHASSRQQVEQWTEKEHRNLVRAYRAHVPVPKPLWQKENVLFLRFLGADGWPSPQLRELSIKKGSKKWTAFYDQTMEAIQKLHCDARLVHGDLSEYNILVCPGSFLKRVDEEGDGGDVGLTGNADGEEAKKPAAVATAGDGNDGGGAKPAAKSEEDGKLRAKPSAKIEEDAKPSAKSMLLNSDDSTKTGKLRDVDDDSLQIVLIDFGQAVDIRHPDSEDLLRRDLLRIKQFFDKMGITTISVEAAMAYVQTKNAPLR